MSQSPFKLDPEKLAGHGLEEMPPWPAEAILEGESKHRRCIFFHGDIVVEVYEAAPGKFQIVAPYDEFIHILEGQLILVATDGETFEYESGDWVMLPKGWTGTWENRGNYRELIAAERKSWEASASASTTGS
jgi:uncharacterized cupin superfamily protein